MSELSLLDTPGAKVRGWFVVYHARIPQRWWMRYVKQGFRHVELARPISYGPALSDVIWLHVLPTFETLDAEVALDPTPPWVRCPQSAIQHVRAVRPLGRVRQWFHIGPFSCVEAVKWALGINSFWVRTPYQLYRYIQRRGGVITG